MRLELATHRVEDGALEEAVAALRFEDGRLAAAEATIVRPGEPVRIVHVLDAVEPRVKADDPEATFPGALGTLVPAGSGRTSRIEGCAVLACAEVPGSDQQEGIVDMDGPGAPLTPFSRTTNVVLRLEPAPGTSGEDFMAAIREAKLRAARDLALALTAGREPERVETLAHELGGRGNGGLPAVALLLQLSALGPFESIRLYGTTLDGFQPAPLNPLEVLDGALVSDECFWAGLRIPTHFFQNAEIVRELLAADGRRLRFAGLVACRGYNQGAREKERAAMLAAKLAGELGADGAIVTTDGGGNSHTDTMLTVRACERAGIRTVAVVAELGGLTDHVPEAETIVSVGNADELVPEWRPERVVGGERLLDGRPAGEPAPVPVRNYLGATSQAGQTALRAVTW